MKNNRVRVSKLSAVEDPEVSTPDWEEHIEGQNNWGQSVPVDYTIEGYLRNDVEVDKPLIIDRTSRNGVNASGVFTSSYVRHIMPSENRLIIKTNNSIYRLEWLD